MGTRATLLTLFATRFISRVMRQARGRRGCEQVLMSLLLAGLLSLSAFGQAPTGQVLGTVLDGSGSVLPDVAVAVTNAATGQRVSAMSDERGDYIVRALPPGVYTVTVERAGFKTYLRQGVSVAAFQNVRVDIALEAGVVTESMQVTGDAPLVDTRSSTVGTLVDDKRIVELPLNGRNVISLTALIPGVARADTPSTVSFSQQRVNVNGNRAYSTNMQLDGGTMYYAHRGQGIIPPPPDAVQEVKVITSGVTAEYGRGTAVVSLVTRSGTNQLHGSLWEYLRNDALDARSFFDRTKAKLRYNQFGGTVGGPVIKNKLFYFGSYQGTRIRQDASATAAFPPTAAERRGDFSMSSPAPLDPLTGQPFPNGIIPANRFDPVAVRLLEKIPLPNDPSGRLSVLAPVPTDGDNVVGKFDYSHTESDRLSFRYYFDYQRTVSAFAPPGSNITGYSPAPQTQEATALTLNHLHTWSPKLIMSSRASFSRFLYNESSSVRESLADLGSNFPNGGGPSRLPRLDVRGRFLASPGRINERNGQNYDFAQDWTFQAGRSEWKWGAQLQRHAYDRSNSSESSGFFTFDGSLTRNAMADFLLGRSVNFTQNSLNLQGGYYFLPAFYVQNNLRVSRRLTLNLGVRSEMYTPWRERKGEQAIYIAGVQSRTFPSAPLGLVFQDDPEFHYDTDGVNIGPRIGFAWDVFGDGRTSVRGGYAVSYDGIIGESRLEGNQPYALAVQITNPGPLTNPHANVPNPFPYEVNPARARFNLPVTVPSHISGRLEPMYNQNINLTVERQLAADWMLQVSYVGNLGRKLLSVRQANPAVFRPGATTQNTESRRLLGSNFTGFPGYSSDGNSSYHSLQNVIIKRFSGGFTLLGHYTWSKAIDDVCTSETLSDCRQQDPFDRRGSRGVSDHDRTHVAVFSYLYELPFFRNNTGFLRQVFGQWQLAGINRFQSGSAFTVLTGTDASLTAVNADRPDLIGNPTLPGGRARGEQIAQWFNTSAFRRNAPGTYGNVGRNSLRGPGGYFWDISLQKEFSTFREQRLEFRAEFFNVLNHANLGNPQTSLNAPQSFGRITSASGGRVVQLGLRYQF